MAPVLLGGFAVAMCILAEHPQCVYYTGLACGVYGLLRVATHPRRVAALACLACTVIVGCALSAAQLIPGMDASAESSRANGVSYDFARVRSLQPADCVARGIPLEAGHHHFVLEYRPAGFTSSIWISCVSLAAWLVGLGYDVFRRRRRRSDCDASRLAEYT